MGKHALLVGVSKFQDPALGGLKAPAEDVQALAGILQDNERGGFDTVITSLDEDVETIRGKLSDVLDNRRPSDSVLIYYSGHGINAASGQLFLATEKTAAQRPRLYSLAASEIRDMMRESRASQLIVVLDCCHSGAFMEGAKGAAVPVSQQTFSAGDGAEGEYVLMSCNAMQVSLDGVDSALSRFTSWMVDGLRGEAAPDNPVITLDDLYDYVCRRARAAGAAMTPQRLVNRNSGIPEIARNPGVGNELPPDLLAKLEDADWKIRLAAVATLDGLSRQDRLRPLVRTAAVTRLAVERDTDVTAALTALISRRRDGPEPNTTTIPDTKETDRRAPDSGTIAGGRGAEGAATEAMSFDKWEKKALVLSGLAGSGLSAAAVRELQIRARALRNAAWNWRGAIAAMILLPILGFGSAEYRWGVLPGIFIGSLAGLFFKPRPAATASLPEDARKIEAAIPIVHFFADYEFNLFRKTCRWAAAVFGATVLLMIILTLNGTLAHNYVPPT